MSLRQPQSGSTAGNRGFTLLELLISLTIGLVVLGGMLKRFGFRTVITLGALAYFVRYFIWSTHLPVPALVSLKRTGT